MKRFALLLAIVLLSELTAAAQGPIVIYRTVTRPRKIETDAADPYGKLRTYGVYFIFDIAAARSDFVFFIDSKTAGKSIGTAGFYNWMQYTMPPATSKIADGFFVGTDFGAGGGGFHNTSYLFQGRPQNVLVDDANNVTAGLPTRVTARIEITAGLASGRGVFYRFQGAGALDLIHTQEINRNMKTLQDAEDLVISLLVAEGYPHP